MRITSKGQVTIPIEIREKLGLVPESEVDFKLEGNSARLVKVPAKGARSRGSTVVERLRGKGDIKMSTDQILALTRRGQMKPVLVDSNVLLDIATNDHRWASWSADALEHAANQATLVINPLVYAEVSVRFSRIEDLEVAIPSELFRREPLPFEAAFLAGKAFLKYRRKGGSRSSPLPDFYIGAHAAVADLRLLTRDATRYRTYFPTVELIAPA